MVRDQPCSAALTAADTRPISALPASFALASAMTLPKRLSAQELQSSITAIVEELSAELGRKPTSSEMGKVMALAKAKLAGKADMGQVSAAVKAALQG